MSLKVLVVDDQGIVRAGFAAVIDAEDDLTVVGEAADGVAAVQLAEELGPDVVLMDVRMPHLDGIAATRIITGRENPPRVLVLTTFDLDAYVFEALRAGASGFLLKDVHPHILLRG
ncbi:response regulator transcription factor, partial [Streptomyces sp. MBT57]|nr:response regulator transcription factor [Streptomyces sp. MBT57]